MKAENKQEVDMLTSEYLRYLHEIVQEFLNDVMNKKTDISEIFKRAMADSYKKGYSEGKKEGKKAVEAKCPCMQKGEKGNEE
jgi:hypothetical protein